MCDHYVKGKCWRYASLTKSMALSTACKCPLRDQKQSLFSHFKLWFHGCFELNSNSGWLSCKDMVHLTHLMLQPAANTQKYSFFSTETLAFGSYTHMKSPDSYILSKHKMTFRGHWSDLANHIYEGKIVCTYRLCLPTSTSQSKFQAS